MTPSPDNTSNVTVSPATPSPGNTTSNVNTTSNATASPATPSPESLSPAVKGIQTAAMAAAAVSSILSPSPLLAGQLASAFRLQKCVPHEPTPIDSIGNPFGTTMNISVPGPRENSKFFSALVGNSVLITSPWIVSAVMSIVYPDWYSHSVKLSVQIHLYLLNGLVSSGMYAALYIDGIYRATGIAALTVYVAVTAFLFVRNLRPRGCQAYVVDAPFPVWNKDRAFHYDMSVFAWRRQIWVAGFMQDPAFVMAYGGLFSSCINVRRWFIAVETAISFVLAAVVGLPWITCEGQVVLATSIQAVELLLLLILRPRHTHHLFVLEVVGSIGKLIIVATSQAGRGTPQTLGAIAGTVVTVVASVFAMSSLVRFILKHSDKREKKKREKRERAIRPEDDEAAPLDVYVPPMYHAVMTPPVEMSPVW